MRERDREIETDRKERKGVVKIKSIDSMTTVNINRQTDKKSNITTKIDPKLYCRFCYLPLTS